MTTTVYLIRHAEYESPDHILPVRLPGFHLSEDGKATAKKIAEYFFKKNIAAIYSSPLERTRETAEIIAEKIHKNIILDDRLLEIRSPTQGKPEGFSESMRGWNMYESEWYKKENGETLEEIATRMDAFMKEKVAEHRGKEIIVVSHGDPIMVYHARYLGKQITPAELALVPYVQMGECIKLMYEEVPPGAACS